MLQPTVGEVFTESGRMGAVSSSRALIHLGLVASTFASLGLVLDSLCTTQACRHWNCPVDQPIFSLFGTVLRYCDHHDLTAQQKRPHSVEPQQPAQTLSFLVPQQPIVRLAELAKPSI